MGSDFAARDRQEHLLITDAELMRVTQNYRTPRGQVAIDAGCGSGAFARQLARFGFDVTGIDVADAALAAARRTPLPGVRYQRHDLNAGDPPGLPERGVDLVVCRLVLPLLHNPSQWVRHVRDHWLSPGGRLYLVLPLADPGTEQPGRLPAQQVAELSHGWAGFARYDLRGALTALMLRAAGPDSAAQ
ncbi:class I SAM-dependent methyltransferase [Streptomyces lydicus]|uniref:class I SAM-dependent methyltransferase n=1 Tax=Streptomyces lydicus TaxID=47763 RepID=UPI003790396B